MATAGFQTICVVLGILVDYTISLCCNIGTFRTRLAIYQVLELYTLISYISGW